MIAVTTEPRDFIPMLTPKQRAQILKERLITALAPSILEIKDDSARHRNHPGAKQGGSHFVLTIAASAFDGKTLLTCHRMVYAAAGDLIPQEIHALQIILA